MHDQKKISLMELIEKEIWNISNIIKAGKHKITPK